MPMLNGKVSLIPVSNWSLVKELGLKGSNYFGLFNAGVNLILGTAD